MKKIILVIFMIITLFVKTNIISASHKLIKTETNDKVMFIKEQDGKFMYSWSFDKKAYESKGFEFDMSIKFKSPDKNKIEKLISKNIKKEYVSFNYHGNLPSVATIKVPISKFNDEDRLNIYYYDDVSNKIEAIKNNVMVKNGYATFEISHCSDYILTTSTIQNATNTNNNGIIIIGMLVIIVGLVGYTMFNNKK